MKKESPNSGLYNIRTLYQQSKSDKNKNMSAGSLSVLIDGMLDDQSRKNSSREVGKVTSVDYKVSQIYSKLKLKDNDYIVVTNPVNTVENKADIKFQSIHCTKVSHPNVKTPLVESNIYDIPSSFEEIPLERKDCQAIMSEFEEFEEHSYTKKELENFLLSPIQKGKTFLCKLISLHDKYELIKKISKEEKKSEAGFLNESDTQYLLEFYIKKLKNKLYLTEVNSTSKSLLFAKKTSLSVYNFHFGSSISHFIVEDMKTKLKEIKDKRILYIIESFQLSLKKGLIRDNNFSQLYATPKSEMRKKTKPSSQVDLKVISTENANKKTSKTEKLSIIKFISRKVGSLLEQNIPKIIKPKNVTGSENVLNYYSKSALVTKKEDRLHEDEIERSENDTLSFGQLEVEKNQTYSIKNAENDKIFTVSYTTLGKVKKHMMMVKMYLRGEDSLKSELDLKMSSCYDSRVFKNLENLNNYDAIQ